LINLLRNPGGNFSFFSSFAAQNLDQPANRINNNLKNSAAIENIIYRRSAARTERIRFLTPETVFQFTVNTGASASFSGAPSQKEKISEYRFFPAFLIF